MATHEPDARFERIFLQNACGFEGGVVLFGAYQVLGIPRDGGCSQRCWFGVIIDGCLEYRFES